MVCQQLVFFHTAKYLFGTLLSICVGLLLLKFPSKMNRMFFPLKLVFWWNLQTGIVPAAMFCLQWVGGGSVTTHERGKRVCDSTAYGERWERNSLVLEKCARGGEDLNFLCFSLEVSYREEAKISSRQGTCSFPSSLKEEEKSMISSSKYIGFIAYGPRCSMTWKHIFMKLECVSGLVCGYHWRLYTNTVIGGSCIIALLTYLFTVVTVTFHVAAAEAKTIQQGQNVIILQWGFLLQY